MNRPQRVTDDLDRLLEVLPQVVQTCLASEAARDQLIEVVLDLGRVPEARYPARAVSLGAEPPGSARVGSIGGEGWGLRR